MRMIRCIVLSCLLVFTASCSRTSKEDPPPIDPSLQKELSAWLEKEGQSPEDFISGMFQNHDVVFLGEQHRIRHNLIFVQALLAPLHETGVRVIATEFGRREDQPLIDSLVTAEQWHEDLARRIVFQQYVWWGYQEYVDVYRAVWELNRLIDDESQYFRILGLNDSPDWSHIKTRGDMDDPETKKLVWHGGGEIFWAEVILNVVDSGEKVLVHCGIHHAFTQYRQPIVMDGEFSHFDHSLRCGNHVFEALGKNAVTVFLHAPWNGPEGYDSRVTYPADGIIDALMFAIGPHPVGFELKDTPPGRISGRNSVYHHGYDDFCLMDFCDGWIYTKPISEYMGVTAIQDWVNETNLHHARSQSPNPFYRDASADKFNSSILKSADIGRRWGHLK